MLTTDSAKLCIGTKVWWILKWWLSKIQNQCFFSFFQKLFDYIFIFHENMSNWKCSGNFCFFTLKPGSSLFQAGRIYLLLLPQKHAIPKSKDRLPTISKQGTWISRRSLGVLEDLAGAYLPLRYCQTASCSTSKETKRQRTSNIRFKPRNKCYCYIVWDHPSL